MVANSPSKKAVELLQELGLKEYEAKAFIALTQIPTGTAREVSDVSDVPRTRVYDAVESLEKKGLVEIQHANPKQFRAVSVDEAVGTLRAEYESRTASLRATLDDVQSIDMDTDGEIPQKVWSLAGESAISSRITQLTKNAETEVIMFIGEASGFSEPIAEALIDTCARGISTHIGAVNGELAADIEARIPEATVFEATQEWMRPPQGTDEEAIISRLLLVDQGNILVSTTSERTPSEDADETAIFGQGFDNGFVTVVRRLMSTGLMPVSSGGPDME